ncbi:CheY-like chemotaxis protein [Cryobacterium mesophilum]|uniref:Response regulator n=1 Tax=Terrimesophilobacter mesophilus TaxID=433647 RepID=A0A4R8VBE3_9MICO|nr:response regulator [Terrimesophilobacter mesophilus]MBB5633878.1 CheY-like chemotaxis protein [Terrimesophilobacter mesophilus]TFB80554.1 response regulator [Terrimesophilobacter mesophilus]
MESATIAPAVRVLIVEDGEDQRFLMQRYFELAGCEVTAVETAEAALETMPTQDPDLVMTDLILPGMNGWELAERIQSGWPDCVVVSSSVLEAARHPPLAARLMKPVSRADVRSLLEKLVPRWAA